MPTCASYRVLASRMDSPRGRIHALKAIAHGEVAYDLARLMEPRVEPLNWPGFAEAVVRHFSG